MAALLAQHFRFGARVACVRSDDADFLDRFAVNFLDCQVDAAEAPAGCPRMDVHVQDAVACVTAHLPGFDASADPGVFSRLFPEMALVPIPDGPANDSIRFSSPRAASADFALRLSADRLEIDRALPWQALLGHFFVHRVMQAQPELLFLHAATVDIGGRGILLCGDKGAGKSTLSLALAARGHAFLGDEIAAVDPQARRLLPFRRRASLRLGPQATRVAEHLARHPVEHETLADGSVRSRVQVSTMFEQARAESPVELAGAFFLGPRDARPSVRRIDFEWSDLPQASPLAATMSAAPAGQRALSMLRMFQSISCFGLRPGGTPDQTADLIEQALEA